MPENTKPSTTSTAPSASPGSSGAGESNLRVLPIHVVDLGKARSGDVKDLKKGGGKLLDEVADAVYDVQLGLDENTEKNVVPVVLVVERKRKRKRRI
jgi:hypothetical protein